MKLQLTQHGKTVTIETDRDDLTSLELTQEFRCLMLAQDYHPHSVATSMPDEEEISNIVMDELKKELDMRSEEDEDWDID